MIDPVVSVAVFGGRGRSQNRSRRWNYYDWGASSFADRRNGEIWCEDATLSREFYKQTNNTVLLRDQLFIYYNPDLRVFAFTTG